MQVRARVKGWGQASSRLPGSGSTEGGLVRTFLALASSPARSTRTAIGVREAEGEASAA